MIVLVECRIEIGLLVVFGFVVFMVLVKWCSIVLLFGLMFFGIFGEICMSVWLFGVI